MELSKVIIWFCWLDWRDPKHVKTKFDMMAAVFQPCMLITVTMIALVAWTVDFHAELTRVFH